MKTIRFKDAWRYSRKGDVIDEGDGVAELLIQRGIAEEVKTEKAETEQTKTEGMIVAENQTEGNQTEEESAGTDTGTGTQTGEDQGTADGSPLPEVITRRIPGPGEAQSRRGGRG